MSQTWNLLTLVLCFTFLKMMKRWSRWSSKADVQQWDTYPELTELLLIGCSIELIWTPNIQIKDVDTKNQLADILTKGNFTRDEWNHLLHLFNIINFSSASCPKTMAKRIVAKSKPTLSLVSHTAASSSTTLRDTPSVQSKFESCSQCRETCSWRFKSEWCEETRCYRNEPEPGCSSQCKETCRRKFRHHRRL